MKRLPLPVLITALGLSLGSGLPVWNAGAADPPAPAKGKERDNEGWIVLFDGSAGSLAGWQDRNGAETKWKIDDGALTGRKGYGDVWTKEKFGDFLLELEFKTTGNSGVFVRTSDPKDNVQTGIEVQVENGGGPSRHSVGAIYDLVAPTRDAAKKDDWNKLRVRCEGAEIEVHLNGEPVSAIQLDKWTTPGKNPDGTDNKFKRAVKDFARTGYIGLQDHDHEVRYRAIRVKPLKAAP